jgi:transcriptional regulator with XRE-family HTH domain
MRPALSLLRENVERERGLRGWTQADLARKMSMAPTQLSQLLKGESSPGLDMLERIAIAFEISVSALLRAPEVSTVHEIRECHARVGRALEEWEKMARAVQQAATGGGGARSPKKKGNH